MLFRAGHSQRLFNVCKGKAGNCVCAWGSTVEWWNFDTTQSQCSQQNSSCFTWSRRLVDPISGLDAVEKNIIVASARIRTLILMKL